MKRDYTIPCSQHRISRHDIDAQGNVTFFRKPGECPGVHHSYIGSGGEVIPCWYILAKTPVMGNALDVPFLDIWNSPEYQDYRVKMVNEWANPLCHRCIGIGPKGMVRKLT